MLVNAHDDFHQRTLPGAVAADQRKNLSLTQLQADSLQYLIHAESLMYIFYR